MQSERPAAWPSNAEVVEVLDNKKATITRKSSVRKVSQIVATIARGQNDCVWQSLVGG